MLAQHMYIVIVSMQRGVKQHMLLPCTWMHLESTIDSWHGTDLMVLS